MDRTIRAPLTFGQLSVWRSIQHLPPDTTEANLGQEWDLADGTDVAAVRRALDALEARHEALRTTFVGAGGRGIEQAVHPPTGVAVPVVEVDGEAGPHDGEVARLSARGFAVDREAAWRVALLVVDGRPTRLLVCAHHLVADAAGLQILQDELRALLAGEPLDDAAPTCRQIAAEQLDGAWDGRTRAAVDHWRSCVVGGPGGEAAPDAATDICWADLRSIPALGAARHLADRAGVSLHTVVLGAFCRAVGARDGATDLVVGLIAGNRTDARTRRLVSSVNQLVPVRVRLEPGEPFAELAARLRWSTLAAYRRGAFDVDALRELREAHGYDAAGAGFRYFFNFSDTLRQRRADADPLGPEGWTIETHATGRDNGFTVYFTGTAGSLLRCRLRERSHEPRSPAAAERLTARTRALLLTFQHILLDEAASAVTTGGPR